MATTCRDCGQPVTFAVKPGGGWSRPINVPIEPLVQADISTLAQMVLVWDPAQAVHYVAGDVANIRTGTWHQCALRPAEQAVRTVAVPKDNWPFGDDDYQDNVDDAHVVQPEPRRFETSWDRAEKRRAEYAEAQAAKEAKRQAQLAEHEARQQVINAALIASRKQFSYVVKNMAHEFFPAGSRTGSQYQAYKDYLGSFYIQVGLTIECKQCNAPVGSFCNRINSSPSFPIDKYPHVKNLHTYRLDEVRSNPDITRNFIAEYRD